MIKHRHILAGATVAVALMSSVVPAQAGLIGGAGGGLTGNGGLGGGIGPTGGSLGGSLNGQSTWRTPSAQPVVDKTQSTAAEAKEGAADKAAAAKDSASTKATAVKDTAAAKAAAAKDATTSKAAAAKDTAVDKAGHAKDQLAAHKPNLSASGAADGGASSDGRTTSVNGSFNGSVQR